MPGRPTYGRFTDDAPAAHARHAAVPGHCSAAAADHRGGVMDGARYSTMDELTVPAVAADKALVFQL